MMVSSAPLFRSLRTTLGLGAFFLGLTISLLAPVAHADEPAEVPIGTAAQCAASYAGCPGWNDMNIEKKVWCCIRTPQDRWTWHRLTIRVFNQLENPSARCYQLMNVERTEDPCSAQVEPPARTCCSK